jgi:hypothetical protein
LYLRYRLDSKVYGLQNWSECDEINKPAVSNSGGRDSVVGIETCYGLEGPGFKHRLGRDFPHLSRPAVRPTHSPVKWAPVSFLGIKLPERGVDKPPAASSAEVEEIGELNLYSPCVPSWHVIG